MKLIHKIAFLLFGFLVSCSSTPTKETNDKIVSSSVQKSIVVYGSNQCSHCINFKAKLDSVVLEYTFHDIDVSDQHTLEMLEKVKTAGRNLDDISLPVVFIDNNELFIAPPFSKVLDVFN